MRRSAPLLLMCAGLVVLGYLTASSALAGPGYPLDDSWIHQTYARNLGEQGEWAFLPGIPSAGSTAPLWSVLLAAGYALNLPPMTWTFCLGGLCLFGAAFTGERLFRSLSPGAAWRIPFAGLFLTGEWHLAWAAVSGMETLLAALLVLLVLWRVGQTRGEGWLWVGALIGLSAWVRPDGITLLGPALFVLLLGSLRPGSGLRVNRTVLTGLAWLAVGFALVFGPYLLFNWRIQGSLWPNTFYAKQAEYAILREAPLWQRLFQQWSLPWVGAGLFLLPGFLYAMVSAITGRRWHVLASLLWALGYTAVYALRLPVVYQYGRYIMPAMPVFWLLGLGGSLDLLRLLQKRRLGWVLARVGVASFVLVWFGFLLIGANRFATDVATIETEMVAAARWVAANTTAETRIAAHDIGALGFFAPRPLVDLAGLVSPEVIPLIRDEPALAHWLDAQQVEYLIVLNGWYAQLPQGKLLVWSSGGAFAEQQGGGNMEIYRWNGSP